MDLIGGSPEAFDKQRHEPLVPDVSTRCLQVYATLDKMLTPLCCCSCCRYGSGSGLFSSVGCGMHWVCLRKLRAGHSAPCQRKTLREVATVAGRSRSGPLFQGPSALLRQRCVRGSSRLLCTVLPSAHCIHGGLNVIRCAFKPRCAGRRAGWIRRYVW
jgi:hypothetical protein